MGKLSAVLKLVARISLFGEEPMQRQSETKNDMFRSIYQILTPPLGTNCKKKAILLQFRDYTVTSRFFAIIFASFRDHTH